MAEETSEQRSFLHGVVNLPLRPMSQKGRKIAVLISVCCVALILLVWLQESKERFQIFRFFRMAELATLNARFLKRGPVKPCEKVVVVELDEKTIAEAQGYPLPRGTYGKMVDRLAEAGAKVIVFDILFFEPQNKQELDRLDRLIAVWKDAPEAQQTKVNRQRIADLEEARTGIDEDGKLAAAFGRAMEKETWVVSAMSFVSKQEASSGFKGRQLTKDEKRFLHDYTYMQKKPKDREERKELLKLYPPAEAVNAIPVIDRIANNCCGIGYADFTPDGDGVLRYERLVLGYDENFYIPLSVMGVWGFLADFDPQALWLSLDPPGIQVAGIDVPADHKYRMLVNYCGQSGAFRSYSMSDVIHRKFPPDAFKGKLVLVGATAEGIGDRIVTPYSARLPGVEKHATVADNILTQRFIRRSWKTALTDLLAVCVLGLVMGFLLTIFSPVAGLLLTIVLELAWLLFAYYAFCHGVWHNVVYPSLTVFLSFGLVTLYRFAVEDKSRREVKRVLERYMDRAVVSQMLKDVDKIKLGGDSMAITCLFSDVAGFTRISEKLESGQLIQLLNRYFTPLTEIIQQRGGFINKYQGDAIVAAFCVPIESDDHTLRACAAAIDCQKRLERLDKEFEADGLPPMPTRIGLSSGMATVGNIGSAQKLEYTVIGDSINLGQRLEAANKEFGTKTIIGGYTYHGAKDHIAVRDLGHITVVGRDESVRVYELLDYAGRLSDETLKLVTVFENGLKRFQDRQWDEAVGLFQEALAISPEDGPSKKFIELCRQFKKNPPADDWDKSIAMAGK